MNVAVTGANGTVGSAVADHLGADDAYEFTCVDVVDSPERETLVADVRDYAAMRSAFEGQDAVVHLALTPELNSLVTEVDWSEPLVENLEAACTVAGAAIDAGVEAFVFGSSNHVVGMYEVDHAPDIYRPDFEFTLDRATPTRPDSMYAVMKEFGESLCRFAAEYHGLRCYVLRIGNVRPRELDTPYATAERSVERGELERGSAEYERSVARMKAMWLSRRDAAHLVDCCLRDGSVTYDVFYGVSDNERRWLDIEHARDVLGYDPRDDGDDWRAPRE